MALPPDPACGICSKPIRSDTLVLYWEGRFFHVACRSEVTQLKSLSATRRRSMWRAGHDRWDVPSCPGSWQPGRGEGCQVYMMTG
jgi:hypothetical protein